MLASTTTFQCRITFTIAIGALTSCVGSTKLHPTLTTTYATTQLTREELFPFQCPSIATSTFHATIQARKFPAVGLQANATISPIYTFPMF